MQTTTTTPVNPYLPKKKPEAKFGEKGFRKGIPNNRRGTPRARITPIDLRLLAFLSQNPGTTADALRLVNLTKETNLSIGGTIPSKKAITNRMQKMKKFGAVDEFRHPITRQVHYGTTEDGFSMVQAGGYNLQTYKGINGMSLERLNHYAMIGQVSAEFVSPIGYFKKTLGINPVSIEDIVSETQLRADLAEVKAELKAEAKRTRTTPQTFGTWRKETISELVSQMQLGTTNIAMSDLIELHPAMLNLGWSKQAGRNNKDLHIGDLIVKQEHTGELKAKNILVEIELTRKNYQSYQEILHTFAIELRHNLVIGQVIYFTQSRDVENLLRKIDTQQQLNLFETGKLKVMPLTDTEGELIKPQRRIVI